MRRSIYIEFSYFNSSDDLVKLMLNYDGIESVQDGVENSENRLNNSTIIMDSGVKYSIALNYEGVVNQLRSFENEI